MKPLQIPPQPRRADFADADGPWFANSAGDVFPPQDAAWQEAKLAWSKNLRAAMTAHDKARLALQGDELQGAIDYGTPQTQRRAQADLIVRLARGKNPCLKPHHVIAAKQIEEALLSYMLPLRPKISRYGRPFGGASCGRRVVPGEHLSESQRSLWKTYTIWARIVGGRYWARWVKTTPEPGGDWLPVPDAWHTAPIGGRVKTVGPWCPVQPKRWARHLEITVALVIDGVEMSEAAAGLGLRKEDGLAVLRDILRMSLQTFWDLHRRRRHVRVR